MAPCYPSYDPLRNPSCFPCVLAMEWGLGHRIGTKKGGDGKPWERKLQNPHVPRLPNIFHVQVFPLSVGRRAVGWLLVVLVLESNKPIWGLVTPLGVQFPLLGTFRDISSRHSGDALAQRRSSFQEDFARWDGLTWGPKPSGFSRCRPSQLTMALFPSGSHLVCGRILWAWRREGAGLMQSNCGQGHYEEWISQARRKVFGFPWSMGRHRSWYSKCLLHCTSLWKKIVCWKVSKQTLY